MPYTNPIPERKRPSQAASGLKVFAEAEKLMHIAFVLPSAVFIGWLGGAWAAEHWHQSWMMIVGLLFGCVSGLVYVIQQAMIAEKNSRRADAAQAASQSGKEKDQ
jgi:F0F1-type ATP synthase assembly protein I